MSPEGDKEISGTECLTRPGLRCEPRLRTDERIMAVAWGIGSLLAEMDLPGVSSERRAALDGERLSLHEAIKFVPLIEELLEDYRTR